MLSITSTKKTKISLTDYAYHRDIENRLLIAHFTSFDIELLTELLDGSLNRSVQELASLLASSKETVQKTLDKLAPTSLFKQSHDLILLDKERRKYFEGEVIKFDPSFLPGIEYIKTLLKKVPIEILSTWYQLPKSVDDLFESIVEKFLLTPKLFLRHLDELFVEKPLFKAIWQDLLKAPNYTLPLQTLLMRYEMSHEAFEQELLLMEFNFMCALSYQKEGDQWIEVISPFAEWKAYLRHLDETKVGHFINEELIDREKKKSFIAELTWLLKQVKNKPIKMTTIEKTVSDRLLQLRLVETKEALLHPLEVIDDFLAMSDDQKSHLLHRTSILKKEEGSTFYIDRHLREIERALSHFTKSGWIFFDDFLKACVACIGNTKEISLKKNGRYWNYQMPSYSEKERAFIKEMIFERLAEAGTVETGLVEGRPCFRVTSFGNKILSRD